MSATPEDASLESAPMPERPRRRRVTMFLRWAIGIATAIGLLDAGRRASAEAQERAISIDFQEDWFAAAAGLYFVGWLFQAGPWLASLPTFGGGSSNLRTLAAYLVSHLGKYVPGKFMVFFLRKGLLPNAPTFPIIAATFFETFCTMAGGSLLAFASLLYFFPDSPWPFLVATGLLAVVFCFAISPGVYRAAVRVMLVQRTGIRELDSDRGFDARRILVPAPNPSTLAAALTASILSWGFISLSYACVVRGCGADVRWELLLPLALLATPLASVGGFISMIPGQIGVREWVLTALAKEVLRSDYLALTAAVFFRILTLFVEAVVGGVLYLALRRSRG